MKCFYCKNNLSDGLTTHVSDFGKSVIVIRNVPCFKCEFCGGVAYAGSVVKQLEKILGSMQNSLTEVAIVNYSDKTVA